MMLAEVLQHHYLCFYMIVYEPSTFFLFVLEIFFITNSSNLFHTYLY